MSEFKVNQSNFKAMENTFSAVTFAEALERANEVENVRENNKRSMLTALFMVLANELERLELRMGEQLSEMVEKKMESYTKMDESNLEEKIEEAVETWVEDNLNDKIDEAIESWVEDNLDQKMDEEVDSWMYHHSENINDSIEDVVDAWINNSLEEEINRKLDDTLEDKLEGKTDDWIFYNFGDILEEQTRMWMKNHLEEMVKKNMPDLTETQRSSTKPEGTESHSDSADPAEQTEPNMTIRRDMKPANEWDEETLADVKNIAELITDAEFATEYTHAVVKTDLIPQMAVHMANNVAKEHRLMYYITYRQREKNPLEIHFHRPIESTNPNE